MILWFHIIILLLSKWSRTVSLALEYSLFFSSLPASPPSLPLLVCVPSFCCADIAVCLGRHKMCSAPFWRISSLSNPLTSPFLIPGHLSSSVQTWLGFVHKAVCRAGMRTHGQKQLLLLCLKWETKVPVLLSSGLVNYPWFTKPLQSARWSFGTGSPLLQLLQYIKGI